MGREPLPGGAQCTRTVCGAHTGQWGWRSLASRFLLIVGQVPLPLTALGVLWLATWLTIYRGLPLVNIQFSWTAGMLISAAAIAQATF